MPGAAPTKVKLIFCRESGLLLAGCISGGRGVGELMSVISVCLQHGMMDHEVLLFQNGYTPGIDGVADRISAGERRRAGGGQVVGEPNHESRLSVGADFQLI